MEDLTDIIGAGDTLDGFDLDSIDLREPLDRGKPPAGAETGVGLRARVTTRSTGRRLYDLRHVPNAVELLSPLPKPGETIHAIMGGDFAAWDLVPAIISMAGLRVEELHIATLGFNAQNADHLARLIANGQVGHAVVLCSDYFAKSDAVTFREAKAKLEAVGSKLVSTKNHAKVLAVDFVSCGYVVESSANLRSCKNLEQIAVTNDRALLEFHRRWIQKAAGLPC